MSVARAGGVTTDVSGLAIAGGGAEEAPHNGTGDPVAGVAASGNQIIDGLLIGGEWSDGFISYSDPDSPADYGTGYFSDQDRDGFSAQNEGFSQFRAQQLRAVHFALNADIFTQPAGASGFAVEGFTNLGHRIGYDPRRQHERRRYRLRLLSEQWSYRRRLLVRPCFGRYSGHRQLSLAHGAA